MAHHEKLVAFSCKRRGFCPSCGARRMVDGAALLVDEVLPKKPIRPYSELMSKVLGIVTRILSTHLIHQAGFKAPTSSNEWPISRRRREHSGASGNEPIRSKSVTHVSGMDQGELAGPPGLEPGTNGL